MKKKEWTLDMLAAVKRPDRYTGGEFGSIVKESADVRVALAFPDVYEVGMSYLGFKILYHLVNKMEGIAAERVYAPWVDMEALMRERDVVLTTLETKRALSELDAVGFTLQYELSYTNILNMLDLGGVPVRKEDRGDTDPLVLVGGPCVFNPEPLADFIDFFSLGEGEDITVETTYAYSDMTYYGDAYGAGFSEYYFRLGDMTPDSDGNPLGSGYVLDFDLWGATSADADNAVLPEGTYTFSSDIALNTIAADKSCGHYTLPDGSARYRIDYKEGTATVKHTADGYEISGHFVLEDGYRLNFSYKGALTFKNMAPAVSEDINEVFATGEGSYYGDLYGYGTANYTLTFTSSDGKTVLMIDMNDVLDESHDPVISEGTYTLDENGSAAAGKYYEGVIDMWGPMGTYCTINAGTDQEEYLLVNGGTFTVTHKEPGYGFTFDFTTQGGTKVQGSYDGEFEIK